MRIIFSELSQMELDDAIEYYNNKSLNLGNEFLFEILHALDRIGQYPDAWQSTSRRTRRC